MWAFFSRDPLSNFPFEIGENLEGLEDNSVWTLHEGKRKSNGEPVSVFMIDLKNSRSEHIETAKAAHKRIKTLRHPNFVTFIDGLETENVIYVVTEFVKPLRLYLKEEKSNKLVISWGLHQVVKGLCFLHNDCKLKHNNINISSIFVNPAGEWKLGGVDYITSVDGGGSSPLSKLLPALDKYDPPEMSDASRSRKKTHAWSADMWGLGCLIWEVCNGDLPRTSSLKALGKVPKSLVPSYCELVSANPISRPNPAKFIDNCKAAGGFMDNKFVESNLFLEEIQIKDQKEKTQFLRGLSSGLDDFPEVFCKLKILPLLLQAFEYGDAGSAILTPLLKLGKLLDTVEYEAKIVPCVVKMFSSTDRATRVKLLQQLDQFIEYLQPPVVNNQIFPHICHGFNDTNPLIRESTVKAMLLLCPKLNDKNLNIELLKHFARLQSKDDQGGIRTNTTICLGKIACHLNPVTRQKVLSSAYVRAMRDPFPPARSAGVISMLATQKYFSLRDSAFKVLPTLCTLTMDPDKGVRDQTFKAIKAFLERLENVSENPELASEIDADVNAAATTTSQTSAAGWTGWAMSSAMNITSKLYRGKGAQAPEQRPQTGTPDEVTTITPADKGQTESKESEKKRDDKRLEEDRDSQSSYGDEEDDGGGWDNFDEIKEEKTSEMSRDDWPASGWNNGNDVDDDDDGLVDLKPKSTTTSKTTKPVASKPFKLSGKKIQRNEPSDADLGLWEDDSWGSPDTKSSSLCQKNTSSKERTKLNTSPKKEKALVVNKKVEDTFDDWDDGGGGWGEMDDSFAAEGEGEVQGWDDTEDWGSIEDPAPPLVKAVPKKSKSPAKSKALAGWDDDMDFSKETDHTPASAYNWDQPGGQENDFFSSAGFGAKKMSIAAKPAGSVTKMSSSQPKSKPSAPSKTNQRMSSDWGDDDDGWGGGDEGWGGDDEWGGSANNQGLSKAELAKKQREEKRKERERQIQEKRVARKAQGPSKLGAKKD